MIQIYNWVTNYVIYTDNEAQTIGEAVEHAAAQSVDLQGANLVGADLQGANLWFVKLKNAILAGANLSESSLRYANLSNADMRNANLSGANLNYAYLNSSLLMNANLSGAKLNFANLSGAFMLNANLSNVAMRNANLVEADVRKVKLTGAVLEGANIFDTNLYDQDNVQYLPLTCPSHGSFIGWKKISKYPGDYKGDYLVKLQITDKSLRSSSTGYKCRCSYAVVLSIENLETGDFINSITNIRYTGAPTIYKVGETVYPDVFDEDRMNECSSGIHFFVDRQAAILYS